MSNLAYHRSDFRAGQRIELHPGTDRWMRGDMYGEIVRVGSKWIKVKMDRSGHTILIGTGAVYSILD